MTAVWIALGVSALLCAGLAIALASAARRSRASERALTRATDELERLELSFGRFVPKSVVERLTQAQDIRPDRRQVTVMFVDLVGFTRLSEQVDPAVMIPILNDYFRRMSRVIHEHHGHVSRIMGDGIMALFGALTTNKWQAADAVRAALGMREALAELNEDLAQRSLPTLAFGVGIHHGEAVAAVVGSDEMMEFTVMGDVVNVASRVESLTREHGVDILVTGAVRDKLDDRFHLRELPPASVKGKSEPIATFAAESYDI